MAGDSSVKLKFSVWRDFAPDKTLLVRFGPTRDQQIVSSDGDLLQEIYSWHMLEDPFGGVSGEGDRTHLRELLFDRFDAARPPAERRFSALQDFFVEADRIIAAGSAEWTISQQTLCDDDEAPHRLNPLLALKLHLEWLRSSFADQPGISVLVR